MPVAAVQAGSTVACPCGAVLAVPPLAGYLDLPPVEGPEPAAPDSAAEYRDWLRHLTRRVWVTPALVAVNLLVFAGMAADGVSPALPTPDEAIRWGAESGPLIGDGQVWRLLTAAFVHYGLFHLAANLLCLGLVGPLFERLLGPATFLGVYLAAAVVAGVASLAWNPLGGGAGASGAVNGLFGAGYTLLLRLDGATPRLAARTVRRLTWFLTLSVVGDIVGLLRPPRPEWQIDHMAHLAGLATGVLLVAVARLPTETGRPPVSRRRLLAGLSAVLAVAAGGWGWARFANEWVHAAEEADRQVVAANTAYGKAHARWQAAGGGDLRPLADAIDREVLPAVRAAQAAVADPGWVPTGMAVHLDLLRRYCGLLAGGYAKMVAACRSGDGGDMDAANADLDAAERLARATPDPGRK